MIKDFYNNLKYALVFFGIIAIWISIFIGCIHMFQFGMFAGMFSIFLFISVSYAIIETIT